MEQQLEEIWDFMQNKGIADLELFKMIVDASKNYPNEDPEWAVSKGIALLHNAASKICGESKR